MNRELNFAPKETSWSEALAALAALSDREAPLARTFNAGLTSWDFRMEFKLCPKQLGFYSQIDTSF